MNQNKINFLLKILSCKKCEKPYSFEINYFLCRNCGDQIIFQDDILYYLKRNLKNSKLEINNEETFGFEWEKYKNWGFYDIKKTDKNYLEHYGGTIEDTRMAYKSKCRLDKNDIEDKIIMDAGCGNGRYTHETMRISEANCLMISVDASIAALKVAKQNNYKNLDKIIFLNASLDNLPIKENSIDSIFSNGVIMHTKNPYNSFSELARILKKNGVIVINVYQKLNIFFETINSSLRFITTRLNYKNTISFSKLMSQIALKVKKIPKLLEFLNIFFRLQTTSHHMFDWYSAKIVHHHDLNEIKSWYLRNKILPLDNLENYNKSYFKRKWAINLKGIKESN